jgi:hypothetical protein
MTLAKMKKNAAVGGSLLKKLPAIEQRLGTVLDLLWRLDDERTKEAEHAVEFIRKSLKAASEQGD